MEKHYPLAAYQAAFEVDGSWRDIYVFGTDEDDWDTLLAYLRSSSEYETKLLIDEVFHPFTLKAQELFALTSEHSVLMQVDEEQLKLNCHFFWEKQIEFDVDPNDIGSDERLTRLMHFVQDVSMLLQKRIVITPENEEKVHYYSFDPRTGGEAWSLPQWERFKVEVSGSLADIVEYVKRRQDEHEKK